MDTDVYVGRDMEIYKNRDAPMKNAKKTTLEQKQASRHLEQVSREVKNDGYSNIFASLLENICKMIQL